MQTATTKYVFIKEIHQLQFILKFLAFVAPLPKPECIQDSDCPNDKACISEQCQNPCLASPTFCGFNAECRVQLHRAICICREGYTGNAQSRCLERTAVNDTLSDFALLLNILQLDVEATVIAQRTKRASTGNV